MIKRLSLIHCFHMTKELRNYGIDYTSFSYSETNSYKGHSVESKREIYVILPKGKIDLNKDNLINLIVIIFKDYIGKVLKIDNFEDYVISNDLSRITFNV